MKVAPKFPNFPDEADQVELKDKRSAIVAALRKCMLAKGYAETKLTHLARAARLSASHLLYYFPNKQLILEEVCDQITTRILQEITVHRDEPPEERIHVLVDNVFANGAPSRSELGVNLELISLSMHQPPIRKKLTHYNDEMMSYLTDLFEHVPRKPGMSAREAADLAAAIWMGLQINSQYDSGLDQSRARRLFRRSLLDLANINAVELRNESNGPEVLPKKSNQSKRRVQ